MTRDLHCCTSKLTLDSLQPMRADNLRYWQYFIALENDFAATTRFVELADANMQTYSIEYARLLLSAGSEIDVLAKVLCQRHGLVPRPRNIDGYRDAIVSRFPGFATLQVRLPRFSRTLLPWADWSHGSNPSWWRAYNDVKHERNANFAAASLSNTMNSMAGLFTMLCYCCRAQLWSREAQPWPQIFSLDPALSGVEGADLRTGFKIPGFPAPTAADLV